MKVREAFHRIIQRALTLWGESLATEDGTCLEARHLLDKDLLVEEVEVSGHHPQILSQ